jgi:hypothetical protein
MKKLPILGLAFLFFGFAFPATAGVVITEKTTDLIDETTETNTVYLAENGMRSGTEAEYMIFRKDLQVLWIINTADKTYREINNQQVSQMLGGMDDEFEEEIIYEKLASGVEAGKWIADHYAQFEYGEKTAELWFAPFDQLGVKRSDFAITAAFDAFLDPESPAGELGDLTEWKELTGDDVYPVREESYIDGELETITQVMSIERTSIPAEVFDVPAGFTKL